VPHAEHGKPVQLRGEGTETREGEKGPGALGVTPARRRKAGTEPLGTMESVRA